MVYGYNNERCEVYDFGLSWLIYSYDNKTLAFIPKRMDDRYRQTNYPKIRF